MSYNPLDPSQSLDLVNREFFRFFNESPFRYPNAVTAPKVDVYEKKGAVVVKAEIPGVAKEDLNIYIEERAIRLSGQAKKSENFKDEQVHQVERYYGSFSRIVPLPKAIKIDEATAEYRDGILTITAPLIGADDAKGRKLDIQ